MTFYNSFDSKIQCEERNEVSESEYDEVMMLMAQESEAQDGFGTWSDQTERQAALEQDALERIQANKKAWLKGYSPNVDGDSYAGIAI
jgi:hypothetical protein